MTYKSTFNSKEDEVAFAQFSPNNNQTITYL